MTEKGLGDNRIVPDFLRIKHEYLFRLIGNEGRLSLESKCVLLILILLFPCLVLNSFSGQFPGTLEAYFINGWAHFLASIFTGVFAWLLVRFLKRINEKIGHVNSIIHPSRSLRTIERYLTGRKAEQEDKRALFMKEVNRYKKWTKSLTSYKWYYFDAMGGAICGLIVGIYLVGPAHGWILNDLLKGLYVRIWYVFYGFFLGAFLFYIFAGYHAIRKYCQNVVPYGELVPLDPDRTGGLRELGRLSLDLDLIVALPSIAFPIYLLRFKLFEFLGSEPQNISTNSEINIAIILSVLYAFLLVLVFFASISPAHDYMVKAKIEYLLKMHNEYRNMHTMLLQKLNTDAHVDPEEYQILSGLYNLYDRVEGMAVWPLDFRTTVRFLVTSLLPLISIGITISIPS